MSIPLLSVAPKDIMERLSPPLAAVVALSRRHGADFFPFETSDFHQASFQEALLALAEKRLVLGLILVELARSGRLEQLKSLPGFDVPGHLGRMRRQAAMWDLERDAVVGRLSRAGIPAVLLKGAALRFTAYHDSAERGHEDIDVLVPEASLQEAVAALVQGGYEHYSEERIKRYLDFHHHLILKKPQGFVVEVHWALAPARSQFRLDSSAFLRDARPVTTPGGISALVPSREHMVLHVAHQSLENGFSQLRRLVDVDRVVSSAPEFDWDRLGGESKRMRVQGVVAVSLRLAEVLLGTPVPEGVIQGLGLSRAARAHLALLDPVGLALDQRGQRRAVNELLLLWCLPDMRARLRILGEIGSGAWDHNWLAIHPGAFRSGAGTRIAALTKLAAYQAARYSIGLLGLWPGGMGLGRFWGKEGRGAEPHRTPGRDGPALPPARRVG